MKKKASASKAKSTLLSDYMPSPAHFTGMEELINYFNSSEFLSLPYRRRFRSINEKLYEKIIAAPADAYLLSSVLDYFVQVNQEKIFSEPFHFSTFEFWLNNFSGLSDAENAQVRSKIVGKNIPRGDYHPFFPVGMGRVYNGTHFVAAHLSPDVDTMIASFWGWVDAFAARLGTGLHFWCLPGGPPDSPVTSFFASMYGPGFFPIYARTEQTLSLTAMDLLAQKNYVKEVGETLTDTINRESSEKAVILVNGQGHYLGDWHGSDVELVRHINGLFKSCLRWFENNIHTNLITLFAKKDLTTKDLPVFYRSVFDTKIIDSEPALEFTDKQKQDLNDFCKKLIGLENGVQATFRGLAEALNRKGVASLLAFQKEVESLALSGLFTDHGNLGEDRPRIFKHLKKLISDLDDAILAARNFVERLDIVLGIKHEVLNLKSSFIGLRSDVDEMLQKMQDQDFLSVVIYEQDGTLFPVGIVRAVDLYRTCLGTVSLRDFSNLEEVKMAPYLEVISVVDHHKSTLKTISVPTALIGDAQSCNVLMAEQMFLINDRYSLGGMTEASITKQLKEYSAPASSSEVRVFKRLLNRLLAANSGNSYYVHAQREFDEYLSFLHAILDDTDLLTKVSPRDLDCVAQLLNRLKSLILKREVEVINFDDIPRDENFTKLAAQRLLRQEDMYSLYQQVFSFRELEVESNLSLCIDGHYSNIFLDAKEQNGCARVGQTKLFPSNFPYFLQHAEEVRQLWYKKSSEVYQKNHAIDLHIHMMSTIESAKEIYDKASTGYPHSDELWFWCPPVQQGFDHLASFLSGFHLAVEHLLPSMSIELPGPNAMEYAKVFSIYFPSVPKKIASNHQDGLPVAILRYQAATLNSRKAMITPHLPRLI